MKQYSRYKPAKIALSVWCIFIGVGALFGSITMLIAPDGSILHMEAMLPFFEVLPFSEVLFKDYIFSGIALLLVNGLPNILAFVLLLMNKKIGVILGTIFGFTLMLWIVIQFIIFPANFLSISYFIFGLFQLITGYCAYVFYRQEHFVLGEYPNIGSVGDTLVVYLSRMGYTKKIALQVASLNGADILEIKPIDKTSGTSGFWWCGYYGMLRKPMPINEFTVDFSKYSKVTIVAPIWVFSVASPVITFCNLAKGKITNVDYVLVHHLNCKYPKAVVLLDELLGVKHQCVRNVCCKMGRYVSDIINENEENK